MACFERWILTLSHFTNVFSSLKIVQVRPVYHIMFWAWTMFHLRVFSIGIHKKHKSNHYVLLLANFAGLEITQFWSVNYVCLVYELKFLFST